LSNITIGIDAHVLDGRFQGTRTTLTSLLDAIASRVGARRLILYSSNPNALRDRFGTAFAYAKLPVRKSVERLLRFPRLFRRDNVQIGVFQYIAPIWGANIVFIHDILPMTKPEYFPISMRLKTRILFSISIRLARAVIVVSEFTRAEVEHRFIRQAAKLRVIPNGPSFPLEKYRLPPNATTEQYILTVGRIEKRKNVPLLVDAFLKADLEDVKLIIVGSFDLNFKYEPPADDRVSIRHGVDDDELVELYRSASLFVYPSAAEGFGIPLLDATLFGLPIISSNRTAMPEVGGALVHYFDPEATDAVDVLAEEIRRHFSDQPVRRPTQRERDDQSARFSWSRGAEAFLAVADDVAGVLR
jgi:glycosyltransferase involved in cell wall biosynthesis